MTLLEKAPQDYPASNRERGKTGVGEQVIVLRIGYGKDFRAWKVQVRKDGSLRTATASN
jgi:hypothetical protein